MSRNSDLAKFVEEVVQDLADQVDPDEMRYKDYADLTDLRTDLTEVIEGRVSDWEIEQKEKHESTH